MTPALPTPDTCHGFSLQSVCWGYRDIFRRALQGLFDEGWIGPSREAVSREVFGLLNEADQNCFDHVLKEFLGALNPRTRWIMDLPGVFSDVVNTGRLFAEGKLHNGITYFRVFGEGGLGNSPADVRNLMTHVSRLRAIDPDLALSLVRGYRALCGRLAPHELERFIQQGVQIYRRGRTHGLAFMAAETRSAENLIRAITCECRLEDMDSRLCDLLRALVGCEVDVDSLAALDSDALIERGTSTVCLYRWLYLPAVVRHFGSHRQNEAWYLLLAVMAAGMLDANSFPRLHGRPGFETCADLVDGHVARINLLCVVEVVRVWDRMRRAWPGSRRLLDWGARVGFGEQSPSTPAGELLYACLLGGSSSALARAVRALSDTSVNVFDTVALLTDAEVDAWVEMCPGIDRIPIRSFAFLPDFLFPAHVGAAPSDLLVARLQDEARQRCGSAEERDGHDPVLQPGQPEAPGAGETTEDQPAGGIPARFVYDEWSQTENCYLPDHCLLRELHESEAPHVQVPPDVGINAGRVRRMFERVKPDLVRKEKRLADGVAIDPDRLITHMVMRHREAEPRVDFYERPLVNKRDLGVLILLDVSGSTGDQAGMTKVLDVEKQSGLIFGEGLHALGDSFSVCGFSGSGRENCEYFVYKEFEDDWGDSAIRRLWNAHPRGGTRMGVALRHSGHRIERRSNRQRLVILITDGKPMDAGYDPQTRYAQHDVRKACEENRRRDIHTFAISTAENTRADMEIMFPQGRFVILPDIQSLPRVLPRIYLSLTV